MSVSNYLPIASFYAGRSVLLTGGSGFLGKVLLEKLLYSCPKVDKVFLLMRDNNTGTVEQRFQKIVNLPIFTRLKKERPHALQKVVLLKGDITYNKLGMKNSDFDTVKKQVSVVFHSAASIKFNDTLKSVFKTNVEGTKNVLNLCHEIKNLQTFVHVSTAYCILNSVIEERTYLPPNTLEETNRFAKQENCEENLQKILNGSPNKYTLSKALAEHLVSETHGDIPTVIIRPSVVTPSMEEPVRGWIDNWFGVTNFFFHVGKGYCRVIRCDRNHVIDLIPVDYACNLSIVAAARAKRENEVTVYNSCSSGSNPFKMQQAFDLYSRECIKHKLNELPYPGVILTQQPLVLGAVNAATYLVAYVADVLQTVKRTKPKKTEIVYRITKARDELEPFTSRSWLMKTDRSEALFQSLYQEDANQFPFLANDINWSEYMQLYFNGVQKFLT